MDKFIRILILTLFVGFLGSCEMDNLDEPTAGLYGKIIDEKNGELVPQDIVQGSIIELREAGYANVAPQNLIIKNNGTYENSRLFENMYTVQPVRTNFQFVAPQEVKIAGRTMLDFTVKPYVRILEATIEKVGTLVVARFKLEQTSADLIRKIGLYSHRDPNVGEFMQTSRIETTLNALAVPNQIYTIQLETANNANIIPGRSYFFRIGALTVAPETRSNYSPTVVEIKF